MLTKNEFHYTIKEKGEEKLQEESIQKENSIKHVVTKDDLFEEFRQYLGPKYNEILSTIKPKTLSVFTDLLKKVEKTVYFVKGDQEILKQFQAYFIAKCLKERYEYATFMLREYIDAKFDKSDNELFVSGSEKELVFLYLHSESTGSDNMDAWIFRSTLDKIINRKRKDLITVILSERSVPIFEKSKDVKVINLGGARKAQNIQNAKEEHSAQDTTEGSAISRSNSNHTVF